MAQQCPHSGGNIVFTARTLLSSHYRYAMEYPNDCPVNNAGGQRVQNTASINNTVSKQQSVSLYPNPNNGSMSIEYNIKKDAYLEMMDITGNLVGTYNLPAAGNILQVKNENLQNGVYLYRVISNNAVIKQGKIVVMQ